MQSLSDPDQKFKWFRIEGACAVFKKMSYFRDDNMNIIASWARGWSDIMFGLPFVWDGGMDSQDNYNEG